MAIAGLFFTAAAAILLHRLEEPHALGVAFKIAVKLSREQVVAHLVGAFADFLGQSLHLEHIFGHNLQHFRHREVAGVEFFDRGDLQEFAETNRREATAHLHSFGHGVKLFEQFVVETLGVFMHLDEGAADDVPVQVVQLGVQNSEIGEINLDGADGRGFASLVVSMRAGHFYFSYQICAAIRSPC